MWHKIDVFLFFYCNRYRLIDLKQNYIAECVSAVNAPPQNAVSLSVSNERMTCPNGKTWLHVHYHLLTASMASGSFSFSRLWSCMEMFPLRSYPKELCVSVENVRGRPCLQSALTGCIQLQRVQTYWIGVSVFSFVWAHNKEQSTDCPSQQPVMIHEHYRMEVEQFLRMRQCDTVRCCVPVILNFWRRLFWLLLSYLLTPEMAPVRWRVSVSDQFQRLAWRAALSSVND